MPFLFSSVDAAGISMTEFANSPIFSKGTEYISVLSVEETSVTADEVGIVGNSEFELLEAGKLRGNRANLGCFC